MLFPLRAAQRLALLLRLLAAAVLHIAQHGRPLIVLLRDGCRAVALRLGGLGRPSPAAPVESGRVPIRTRDAASSIRSTALSGRKRSVM